MDLIYKTQHELRDYHIYDDSDIIAFSDIYYSAKKQDDKMMGKMTSALKPVADRYNALPTDGRYQFRRTLRSLIKWYGYITQICRMFDKDMQKEYVFCQYLLRLIPVDPTPPLDIEGALKLEFYKLEKTFQGVIGLEKTNIQYDPKQVKGVANPEAKEPLDEIINRINMLYGGTFTDGDKVLLNALREKLSSDDKLRKLARTSDPQIFIETVFPKIFDTVAQDAYVEQTEAYTSLFENKSKYTAVMSALAEVMYREMRAR